jgi:hypothetical protein
MAASQNNIDLSLTGKTILNWLQSRLDEEAYTWVESKSKHLKEGGEDWEFYTAFSAVPRHTGKGPLSLTDQEKQQAEAIRTGWKPAGWTTDQLGRTLLVLSMAQSKDQEAFLAMLEKTFISSDMGEGVALYQSLSILPYPDRLQKRAAEGLRSNMTSVFNAAALKNPYPADYFDDGAWNQLVLKALFVGSPLYKIEGIDRRRNAKLADMLVDYAHERWAAGRSVSPELWRPVGPYAKDDIIGDLQKVLSQQQNIQKQAVLLALSESPSDNARAIVEAHKSLRKEIEQEEINWDTIGRRYDE